MWLQCDVEQFSFVFLAKVPEESFISFFSFLLSFPVFLSRSTLSTGTDRLIIPFLVVNALSVLIPRSMQRGSLSLLFALPCLYTVVHGMLDGWDLG